MTSKTKMFSDLNGLTVELFGNVQPLSNKEFAAAFPTIKGRRFDSFSMKVGRAADGRYLPLTRAIHMKSHPSRHECDARCMNATGRTMNCECSCGGVNHGRGAFQCAEAA
jgi:hypothetical protein